MSSWISYQSGEVRSYHPICEHALEAALQLLRQTDNYEVVHHQYTGTLEMDYVVRNRHTNKYLCVFEVKRTPSDVQSMRYQWQAMSYVANSLPQLERPYYVITNLEYSIAFRYDATRPGVTRQMLEPGLLKSGSFDKLTQNEFEEALAKQFSVLLDAFIRDQYKYMVTLEQFEQHMEALINDNRLRKSILAIYSYEYIRGAFEAVGRKDFTADVRIFRNNVRQICEEAARIDFAGIFNYNEVDYEPKAVVDNTELANVYNYGKQTVSADSIVEILHRIVSHGHEHDNGEVPTDLELATFVSILAKYLHGELKDDEVICDPGVGSGNLISAAVNVFNLTPRKIKVNDINPGLMELLTLRMGLLFPETVSKANCAHISISDLADLTPEYFNNIGIIVMNPPFVAGINCVNKKAKFSEAIKNITHEKPITDIGQMYLEGLFIELVCDLVKEGTTLSCVIPATHLTARGPEGVAFRRMLIEKFGLQLIFNYPMDGLFEDVIKGTCIIAGTKGASSDKVTILAAYDKISDIDINEFMRALTTGELSEDFKTLIPGVQARQEDSYDLMQALSDGWRETSKEMCDAIHYVSNGIRSSRIMKRLEDMELKIWRGPLGNSGGSDLLFIKEDSTFYNSLKHIFEGNMKPALRSGKYAKFIVGEGDSRFFDIRNLEDRDIYTVVDAYMQLPLKGGSQPRTAKTRDQYMDMLRRFSKRPAPANSVLLPRLPRSRALTILAEEEAYISTNYIIIENNTYRDAVIFATWANTLFYLLECEMSCKNQDGVRKMEKEDFLKTYVPDPNCITQEQYNKLVSAMNSITGRRDLSAPDIISVDFVWAEILFGNTAQEMLNDAKRLLIMLANMRNRD